MRCAPYPSTRNLQIAQTTQNPKIEIRSIVLSATVPRIRQSLAPYPSTRNPQPPPETHNSHNLKPKTRKSNIETRTPKTPNPKLSTLDFNPWSPHSQRWSGGCLPETRNPKPGTRNSGGRRVQGYLAHKNPLPPLGLL